MDLLALEALGPEDCFNPHVAAEVIWHSICHSRFHSLNMGATAGRGDGSSTGIGRTASRSTANSSRPRMTLRASSIRAS